MFDTFRMLITELLTESLFIFIFEVERGLVEDWILLNDLVENVNVQRKSLCAFKLLDQFSANRASHSILVVQLLDAVRAESMSAVNQYAWNTFTNVVLERAELAYIELARLVIQIHDVNVHLQNGKDSGLVRSNN